MDRRGFLGALLGAPFFSKLNVFKEENVWSKRLVPGVLKSYVTLKTCPDYYKSRVQLDGSPLDDIIRYGGSFNSIINVGFKQNRDASNDVFIGESDPFQTFVVTT